MCHVTLYNRQLPGVVTTLLPGVAGRSCDLCGSRLEIRSAHGKTDAQVWKLRTCDPAPKGPASRGAGLFVGESARFLSSPQFAPHPSCRLKPRITARLAAYCFCQYTMIRNVRYCLHGVTFEWDATIGRTESQALLFVVHVIRHEEIIRIISARYATPQERRTFE